MGLPAGGSLSLFCPGGDLGQPPPAHMGIPPPYQLDSKLAAGLARTPMYPFPGGTYPYPMLSPEMSQVAASCGGSDKPNESTASNNSKEQNKKPHIKKPLNAFMLYMKEMRAKVVAECTLKESAAINQILGRRWHSLSREEQAKYYEKARQERQLHMQLYPGWSARDNYGYGSKKKKRKKDRSPAELGEKRLEPLLTSRSGARRGDGEPPSLAEPGRAWPSLTEHRRAPPRALSVACSVYCSRRVIVYMYTLHPRSETILWHALGREEQAKYYELARRERQLHMQLYPDWSSRANTQRGKKRKRKQETTDGGTALHSGDAFPLPFPLPRAAVARPGDSLMTDWPRRRRSSPRNNLKKCRARYGLDQQNQWCKPCRRKKKCVRYMEALAAASGNVPLPMVTPQSPCSDEDVKLEEMSDASSDGDADTPLNSASSPGGLSALSSLASPASDPPPPPRNPVGTNPRDANNPLSVGQLTSQSWPRAAQARPGHEVISVS
ncbi:hypothetical protein MSG28_011517 [Choristoneura fumiferana]|uniref:Uncharacterized protein n=1 Tax=Choristoneura fumiferana TaxID=7141 RepID=A0ACC0JP90_CHOFU|nr:hypothetical protein MSG28_011517 [Choristoneura fumiferana]